MFKFPFIFLAFKASLSLYVFVYDVSSPVAILHEECFGSAFNSLASLSPFNATIALY